MGPFMSALKTSKLSRRLGMYRNFRRPQLCEMLADRDPGLQKGAEMIIDAQLHDPAPWLDWSLQDVDAKLDLLTEIAFAYLDALGIAGAVLFSETWGERASRKHPNRFAWVPHVSPHVSDVAAFVAEAKKKQSDGLLALRAVFGWPLDGTEAARVERGDWDIVFDACENQGVPLFMFATRYLSLATEIVDRHSHLQFVLDHIGLPQPPLDTIDEPPFNDLPQVLALAERPNVAMKLCGLPSLSREAYPFSDVVPQLKQIVNAFGADRIMWASDISRFYGRIGLTRSVNKDALGDYPGKHTYSESLDFILRCHELSGDEKAAILGGTVRKLFGWPA
jgi:L-fuconolactonase